MNKLGLAAAIFLSSASVMVLEIAAARLLAPYVGMSIYTWTCIIATILAGMSLGHWFGGHLSETDPTKINRRLAILYGAATFSVILVPFVLRIAAPKLLVDGAPFLVSISVLTALLFFLPSVLIACVTPMITKMAIDAKPEARGRTLGRMYALGALGSILGTVAAGFVFISWIGTAGTILSVAAALAIMGAAFAVTARHKLTISIVVALLVIAAVATILGRTAFASVCLEESRYYCIRVVDFVDPDATEARLMVLDHMGHGINERRDPTALHSSYVELTHEIVQQRFGQIRNLRSFFIGGGAYTLPRTWAGRFPDGRHTVSEIDPAVTRAAIHHMWFKLHPSIKIIHQDARRILQRQPRAPLFDVIVGDAFHDISVPAHLVTAEFASEVSARLSKHGVYILTIIDSHREPAFLLAQVRTLSEFFPAVEVWTDVAQASSGKRLTYLLVASRAPVPVARLTSSQFPNRVWARRILTDIAGRLGPADVPILTDDFAPVDRLLRDVSAFGD